MEAICTIITAIIHPIPVRWHVDEESQFGSPSSLDLSFVSVLSLAEFSTATVENMVVAMAPAD